jgi:hypothetical protein
MNDKDDRVHAQTIINSDINNNNINLQATTNKG